MNLATFYFAIDACVFKPLQIFQASNEIECALQCESGESKAFQFDEATKFCKLYEFQEMCQINSICHNETVFVNNKFNNKVNYILYL